MPKEIGLRHGSLFSGIGGFDLAAQWMGWENIFQVEIDPFCQKVLEKNFPNTKRYGDIKEFDGTQYRGTVDILTGGFPCQPFSSSGRRKGTEDDRNLWPEMLRVISEIQPAYIVGENVYGLINWSGGLVFEEMQTSLEGQGYDVTSVILPACGINADHRRDRIWVIAYSAKGVITSRRMWCAEYKEKDSNWETDTSRHAYRIDRGKTWMEVAAEFCGVRTRIPNRVDRVTSLGNAIVPQVAFEIFKAIELCQKK